MKYCYKIPKYYCIHELVIQWEIFVLCCEGLCYVVIMFARVSGPNTSPTFTNLRCTFNSAISRGFFSSRATLFRRGFIWNAHLFLTQSLWMLVKDDGYRFRWYESLCLKFWYQTFQISLIFYTANVLFIKKSSSMSTISPAENLKSRQGRPTHVLIKDACSL